MLPKRMTLSEAIYHELRKEIVSLKLQPGEMIYENELSTRFNVSRTPVRQALAILSREKLVNILPQRGAQIAYLSKKKFFESQRLREVLESYAFVEVAKKWDAKDEFYQNIEKELLENIEKQRKTVEKGDYVMFVYEDEVFHNMILNLCNNETLLEIMYELRAHLNRVRYLEILEARHEDISLQQHRNLVSLLKNNEVDKIGDYLIDHLRTLEPKRESIFNKYSQFFRE